MFSMMSGEAERNADNFEDCREFPETELLAMEKESIGMYVSGHPLDSKAAAVRAASTASISDIIENEDKRFNIGSQVTVSGIITKVRNQLTKKGDMMRYVEFEDLTASMEVIIFPGQLRRFADIAVEGSIVTISGNLDISDDAPPKLRLEDMRMLDETARKRARLYLRLDSTDTVVLNEVKKILKAESGDVSVVIKYSDNGQVVAAPKSMMVKRNDERTEILKKLLGDENVRLVEK